MLMLYIYTLAFICKIFSVPRQVQLDIILNWRWKVKDMDGDGVELSGILKHYSASNLEL